MNLLARDSVSVDHFNSLLEGYNLIQVVDCATRIAQSLLDVLSVSDKGLIEKCSVLDSQDMWDHCIVFARIALVKESKFVAFRDFKCFCEKSFFEDLHVANWDYIYYSQTVDEMVVYKSFNIRALFDKPVRKRKHT